MTKPRERAAERAVIRAAERAERLQRGKTLSEMANMPKYHMAIEATHRAVSRMRSAAPRRRGK